MSGAHERAVFITGTDTECGKTVVSCALQRALQLRGYSTVGMKPVASGAESVDGELVNDDVSALTDAASVPLARETVNPYVYRTAASPHIAAAVEGGAVELDVVRRAFDDCVSAAEVVIVEGVGGWRVPLSDTVQIVDMVRSLELPVLMVVGLRLGCISHALLSAEAIHADGCEFAGWIANGVDPDYGFRAETIRTLEPLLPGPLIGELEWQAGVADRRIGPAMALSANDLWPQK